MRNATIYVEADRGHAMRRTKGFSLIELLIVVAIILIIAAIAIPSFLHSRMAANESAAAAAIRTLNTAQISFNSAYPTVGFASSLAVLGGSGAACAPPTPTTACLIDANLAGGQRSGYYFTLTNTNGTPNSSYNVIATPILANYSGVRSFCSYADAVVRVSMATITTCDGSVPPQQ
jgi:type IV pilus assembly protein PilA